jgi:hypothetical protein
MPLTYTWSDLITVGSRFGKGIPLQNVSPQICDFVSSDMYIEYPWKETITNTANGVIPLLDSVQDYTASAPNISRPLKASLQRTDVTPNENHDLDIVRDLSVNLYPKSYVAIRAMSLQQSVGKFRLESAVNIPSGMQVELRVDFQIDPIKVTGLNQNLWFHDKYAFVALEGLLYWVYKLSDDARAGGAASDAFGRITEYTGQLGNYKGALGRMKNAEEYGFTDSVFPDQAMGEGQVTNSLNIFGW